MLRITKQASILSNQYTIVTTNPPYMGKLEGNLKKFVTSNYKDFSTDVLRYLCDETLILRFKVDIWDL